MIEKIISKLKDIIDKIKCIFISECCVLSKANPS